MIISVTLLDMNCLKLMHSNIVSLCCNVVIFKHSDCIMPVRDGLIVEYIDNNLFCAR